MTNANGTEGKQSPTWSVWNRFNIPCKNGEHYLARLRLIDTPWFGIYLHDIYHEDEGRHPHNHPYSFFSFVLRGHYKETVFPAPDGTCNGQSGWRENHHKRFSLHRMNKTAAHRITEASPGLKTLIIRGKRSPKGWGFFTQPGYIPWQQYQVE